MEEWISILSVLKILMKTVITSSIVIIGRASRFGTLLIMQKLCSSLQDPGATSNPKSQTRTMAMLITNIVRGIAILMTLAMTIATLKRSQENPESTTTPHPHDPSPMHDGKGLVAF